MKGVSGKVVVVTGGGRGLGSSYCARLADEGSKVAVVDIDEEAAAAVADKLRARGGIGHSFRCDVTDPRQVEDMVERVNRELGQVNVLINNAGGLMGAPGPMETFTVEHWTRVLAVNLTGSWLCAQALVPAMKQTRCGRIINISTSMVSQGIPIECAPYIAAKAGVVGLTRALAKELGTFGITVNAVAPGLVPMDRIEPGKPRAEFVQGLVNLVVGQQSLKRVGLPDDLGGTIVFLVSEESAFVTGQVINVDGGWALN